MIGCALLQKQPDETEPPIGDWSQLLNDADQAYETTHCQCLAVVWEVFMLQPYLEGSQFTVRPLSSKRAQMGPECCGLYRKGWALESMTIRVITSRCILCWYKASTSRLFIERKTPGSNQMPIEDGIPVLHINSSISDEGEATVMYLRDYDVLTDKEGAGTTAGYAIATWVKIHRDTSPNSAYNFIHEQAKNSYCRQASFTAGLPGLTFNYGRKRFMVLLHPSTRQYRMSFLCLYSHVFYITRLLYYLHWTALAGHWGGRRMYNEMPREYYCPKMASEILSTVKDFCQCVRNKQKRSKDTTYTYSPPPEDCHLLKGTS